MRQIDAEDSHKISIELASAGIAPADHRTDSNLLQVSIWNKKVDNPIGLAAGYDKNAQAVDAMLGFGFGSVEIGSVTPNAQIGNPKPRVFRLEKDQAVINRYGFNSDGHDSVAYRLMKRIRSFLYKQSSQTFDLDSSVNKSLQAGKLLGVNLGKNKTSPAESDNDYLLGIEKLGPFADYLVINISSPNTPGLRNLQNREPIKRLLSSAIQTRNKTLNHKPPLLVKIAPDLSNAELQDIASVLNEVNIDGVIVSNTTLSRENLKSGNRFYNLDEDLTRQLGGLSGAPVLPRALATVFKLYQLTEGRIPIIGCGGIRSGEDAVAFCKAGASLVQVYTALAYQGPGLVRNIKDQVESICLSEGKSWKDMIGSSHR